MFFSSLMGKSNERGWSALSPLFFVLILMVVFATSCQKEQVDTRQANPAPENRTVDDSLRRQAVDFRNKHHYSINYNFKVKTDSLVLQVQIPEEAANNMPLDTFGVMRNEVLAVAEIRIVPADTIDSVWLQVAQHNSEFGWVREKNLLKNVIPDNTISKFIHFFSTKHHLIFLLIFLSVLCAYGARHVHSKKTHILHIKDIATFYPTMLTISVAMAATIFTSIQMFDTSQWIEYYYHPSVNPFSLPWPLALFVLSAWMIIILVIATVDDCLRHLTLGGIIPYLLGVATMCVINYIVFSFTTRYYAGYILLAVYIGWAVYHYLSHVRNKYICGNCGRQIKEKGKCPYCGVMNE